jgi:hypothetical protein
MVFGRRVDSPVEPDTMRGSWRAARPRCSPRIAHVHHRQALDRVRLGADAMSRALVVPQAEDPTWHALR